MNLEKQKESVLLLVLDYDTCHLQSGVGDPSASGCERGPHWRSRCAGGGANNSVAADLPK